MGSTSSARVSSVLSQSKSILPGAPFGPFFARLRLSGSFAPRYRAACNRAFRTGPDELYEEDGFCLACSSASSARVSLAGGGGVGCFSVGGGGGGGGASEGGGGGGGGASPSGGGGGCSDGGCGVEESTFIGSATLSCLASSSSLTRSTSIAACCSAGPLGPRTSVD